MASRIGTGALYTTVSKCGEAAHQRRPPTCSPRRDCAAKRQFAHATVYARGTRIAIGCGSLRTYLYAWNTHLGYRG